MTLKQRELLFEFARISGVILFSLLIGFVITLLVSKQPLAAFESFLLGPFSRLNRFGNWIEESITLTFTGLAVALVFQAKQFSIGAEGQLYLGALAAGIVGLFINVPAVFHISLALLAAGAAGYLWGFIPGYLKAHLNANEIVSTLMLNAIAIQIYNLLLTYWLKPPYAGYTVSNFFSESAILPNLVPETRISLSLFLAIAAVFLVYYLLYRTTLGYEIRMTGANIKFASYGGINTTRVIILSMAVSGIIAGLAGAALAMGIHKRLILNISMGYGFEGIVVSLLARNHPLAVPFAALFYGYLRTGADVMERSSDVAREIVSVIQAIIILLVTAESFLSFLKRRIALKEPKLDVS
ncbi:MAG: ABC transporter permease [Chloroflexi bacterium]|nr:ABC transporter permease [Chloroflexota bacterium]